MDRVKTVTLPHNSNNLQATETYEYDRTLDANGITNLTGAAVAGRGSVTKITHGDTTYQSFGYDAYGNKRWEDNELRQRHTYTLTITTGCSRSQIQLRQPLRHTYNPTKRRRLAIPAYDQ